MKRFFEGPLPWLKPAVLVGALVPLADLGLAAARRALGADAVAVVLNRLGLLTLIFLLASLAPTPLKRLLGWTWPLRIRRELGLLAFFFALLHVSTYVVIDQFFDWTVILADVTQRKFIWAGLAAWVLLVPLALTSTHATVKRLGFVRWKRLHRLAYVAALLGATHFYLRVKRDHREPLLYALVLGTLLILRLPFERTGNRARRAG